VLGSATPSSRPVGLELNESRSTHLGGRLCRHRHPVRGGLGRVWWIFLRNRWRRPPLAEDHGPGGPQPAHLQASSRTCRPWQAAPFDLKSFQASRPMAVSASGRRLPPLRGPPGAPPVRFLALHTRRVAVGGLQGGAQTSICCEFERHLPEAARKRSTQAGAWTKRAAQRAWGSQRPHRALRGVLDGWLVKLSSGLVTAAMPPGPRWPRAVLLSIADQQHPQANGEVPGRSSAGGASHRPPPHPIG